MHRTRPGGALSATALGLICTMACGGSSGNHGTSTVELLVIKDGIGSGTVSGNGIDCGHTCTSTLFLGDTATLTAVADPGSFLVTWSRCDSTSGATCTVMLGSNRTVYATFDLAGPRYSLTVTKTGSGSGTVTGNGIDCGSSCSIQLPAGTVFSLNATPAAGSTLGSWTGCSSTSGTNCMVGLTSDKIVSAKFDLAAIRVP